MTLAETKEPVKTGKRKVRDYEEDPEVTEWRTRMEEKVERMEEQLSEVKETVESVERCYTWRSLVLCSAQHQKQKDEKDATKGACAATW